MSVVSAFPLNEQTESTTDEVFCIQSKFFAYKMTVSLQIVKILAIKFVLNTGQQPSKRD